MTENNKNILRRPELKAAPYSLPEGYFDDLKRRVTEHAKPAETPGKERRKILMTILSVAATFIIMVSAGTFFLSRVTPDDIYTQEDFLVFSNNITEELLYNAHAEADIQEDDIIEYLIYSGESAETIESYIEL